MKTDSAQIQYDKMTKTPINKLVLQLGLPTTVSMLVTSVYNMADTFFVSQLGTSVSGATGVVLALMAIINAFGFMFGHGAGRNISRKLGAHDIKSARKPASFYPYYAALSFASWLSLPFTLHASPGKYRFHPSSRHRIQHLDPDRSTCHGIQLRYE